MLANINWQEMFKPDIPILETVIRGSITYLSIFILLRVILKRETGGNIGMTDVLVIVLLADASQNAMAGQYNSLTNGIVLVAVIILWSLLLQWLSFHSKFFQRLLSSPKLLIVSEGKMLKKNMRKELVTEDELMMEIRKEGHQSITDIKEAYMESDGTISIVANEK